LTKKNETFEMFFWELWLQITWCKKSCIKTNAGKILTTIFFKKSASWHFLCGQSWNFRFFMWSKLKFSVFCEIRFKFCSCGHSTVSFILKFKAKKNWWRLLCIFSNIFWPIIYCHYNNLWRPRISTIIVISSKLFTAVWYSTLRPNPHLAELTLAYVRCANLSQAIDICDI